MWKNYWNNKQKNILKIFLKRYLARVRYFSSINIYAYNESDILVQIIGDCTLVREYMMPNLFVALKEVFFVSSCYTKTLMIRSLEREKLVDLSRGSIRENGSWGIKSVNIGRDSTNFLWLREIRLIGDVFLWSIETRESNKRYTGITIVHFSKIYYSLIVRE